MEFDMEMLQENSIVLIENLDADLQIEEVMECMAAYLQADQ